LLFLLELGLESLVAQHSLYVALRIVPRCWRAALLHAWTLPGRPAGHSTAML
ncbi:hypothetical protein HAX54_032504, partial [Datura stramonium]|nr:hypothetical protein [Datura stramonium]